MKTLHDVLKDADPLMNDNADRRARQQLRATVLDAPRAEVPASRPRRAVLTLIGLTAIGITAGSLYWTGAIAKAVSVRFAVHLAEDTAGPGLIDAGTTGGRTIYIHQGPVVTNADIAEAHIAPGATPTTFAIAVEFTPAGAARMQEATQHHIGKVMAILIDGEVVMAPVVRAPISTSAMITGDYDRSEAERIVAGIIGR